LYALAADSVGATGSAANARVESRFVDSPEVRSVRSREVRGRHPALSAAEGLAFTDVLLVRNGPTSAF
jgi:hypothetical protein